MNFVPLNLDLIILKLTALAEDAGLLLNQIYKEEIEVFEKSDGSPVTRADHQSHALLKKKLTELTPHIPVISEEDNHSWVIKSPYYWLIDPLDGTKGFIHKTGEFCINIALMKENHPIFGLIHIPLTHETYYGYHGKAWRKHKNEVSSIHTRPYPVEGMTLLLGGYGEKFKTEQDAFLKKYSIGAIKRIRSAIKFCTLAEGQADLYLRFEVCSEWDTAAGHALVEAAGGAMTNIDGTPFLYGKTGLLNGSFAVFGQKV